MLREAGPMANHSSDPFNLASAVAAPTLPLEEVALRLGYAALLGIAVAIVYFLTQRRRRAESASFVSTLVLLTILLAMVSMVIGDEIARAFSLVGALSIVRFRTVVDDTRDTAFVIFAVIAGMAAGAEAYAVPAVGIPVVAVVAWGLSVWGRPSKREAGPGKGAQISPTSTLVIRMGIECEPTPFAPLFAEFLESHRLTSAGTARQGAAMDMTYIVRLKLDANPVALLAGIKRIEGILEVEWVSDEKKK